jgi:hypothetical protein
MEEHRKHKKAKRSDKQHGSKAKHFELTEAEQEDRRRKKSERRAAKVKQELAELGLDEYGQPLDNYSILKYPVREWKFKIPGTSQPIALNPVVTLIGVLLIWGIVVWSTGM